MTAPHRAPEPRSDTVVGAKLVDDQRLAIGVGFRKACTSGILADLVRGALARVADEHGTVVAGREAVLATVAEKDRPTLREAAAELGLSVLIVSKDAVLAAQGGITVTSDAALACLGIPSVAEAAALAAAGPGATLLLSRMTVPQATCAVATLLLSRMTVPQATCAVATVGKPA